VRDYFLFRKLKKSKNFPIKKKKKQQFFFSRKKDFETAHHLLKNLL
jgi:hypothetical protein